MARGVRKRMAASRPKVTWLPGANAATTTPVKQYPLYVLEPAISTSFAQGLVIGRAFICNQMTAPADEPWVIRDFPLLRFPWGGDPGAFKLGTLFMYAGTHRCKEKKQDGTVIVVHRHTFVGPTGRFIVMSPEYMFVPVDDVGKTVFGSAP